MKVCITGGSCSGKEYIAKELCKKNSKFIIINLDTFFSKLIENNKNTLKKLNVILPNGDVDKNKIANNKHYLKLIFNELYNDFKFKIESSERVHLNVIFIFTKVKEFGIEALFDKVYKVTANRQCRIERYKKKYNIKNLDIEKLFNDEVDLSGNHYDIIYNDLPSDVYLTEIAKSLIKKVVNS